MASSKSAAGKKIGNLNVKAGAQKGKKQKDMRARTELEDRIHDAFEAGDYMAFRRLNRELVASQPDTAAAREAAMANESLRPDKRVYYAGLFFLLLYIGGWLVGL